MYKVFTTSNFRNDFDNLDKKVSERIKKKLKYLAENPDLAVRVKYTPESLNNLNKYRIGEWRVLFWVDNDKEEIVLYAVKHRREVYDKL